MAVAHDACAPVVKLVNPLEVDGFAEPAGWGSAESAAADKPLLVFLPGMDGSLSTPFMQYCELSTTFELACMTHTEGLASRASFAELTTACADAIAASAAGGRQVLLVGESFGATLAVAVAHEIQERRSPTPALRGLVLVNPATSYRRSALATIGPLCASLSGLLLAPLYMLSLVALAALVLTPAYQAPSFLSTITGQKATELNNNPYREAFVGRVAMGAYLGTQSEQLAIGPLLAIQIFAPADLRFRLSEWLAHGADLVSEGELMSSLQLPTMAVVGELDRLLPSLDEAARLADACGPQRWRGTTVVNGAGHASTLGNRVDLLQEIRAAFAADFEPPLPPRLDLVGRAEHPGDDGDGWERGLLDRTYEPLDPADYTQMNRGGRLYVGV
jgi:pimeloyl-ACP methyl ester carboxylesterase